MPREPPLEETGERGANFSQKHAPGHRVAVEAAIEDYWYKYVGLDGRVVGMSTFGESAPAGELFKEFGFTVDNIVAVAGELLEA
jgi:transketolase